ncbi:MAG: hypothetical protein ACK43M_14645 [Allorhizobium sp.]
MKLLYLADGQRFVPQEWHGTTISTIPAHADAVACCRVCRAVRVVATEALRAGRNGMMTIPEISARLRCTECGKRDAELLIGYFAGDPPPL